MGHVLIRKKMDVEYPEIQNKIYQDIKQKYWVVSYKSHINHATLQNTSKKWYKKYILLLKKTLKYTKNTFFGAQIPNYKPQPWEKWEFFNFP